MSGEEQTHLSIGAGEKFALIALPRAKLSDALDNLSIAEDLWIARTLPLSIADHWQRWIGEIRTKQLHDAGCYLVAKMRAVSPELLDVENQRLMHRLTFFMDGLLIAATPFCAAKPFMVTGANVDGEISIRQIADLQLPRHLAFNETSILAHLTETDMRDAHNIGEAIAMIASATDYSRLKRALSAFLTGVHEDRYDERLHQFCRCIDGVVLSRKGKGEADFASRTADFIGEGHKDVMSEMYRMRSAVEHLRPAESEAANALTLQDQRSRILHRALQAESIARHCMRQVLLQQDVRTCFANDDDLACFWALEDDERHLKWGTALNFEAHLSNLLDPRYVTDNDIG